MCISGISFICGNHVLYIEQVSALAGSEWMNKQSNSKTISILDENQTNRNHHHNILHVVIAKRLLGTQVLHGMLKLLSFALWNLGFSSVNFGNYGAVFGQTFITSNTIAARMSICDRLGPISHYKLNFDSCNTTNNEQAKDLFDVDIWCGQFLFDFPDVICAKWMTLFIYMVRLNTLGMKFCQSSHKNIVYNMGTM